VLPKHIFLLNYLKNFETKLSLTKLLKCFDFMFSFSTGHKNKSKDSNDGAVLVGVKSLDLVEEEGENESDV
jgi:hypothetical protein